MIQTTKAFIADQIERIERMEAMQELNEINEQIEQYYDNSNQTINRTFRRGF